MLFRLALALGRTVAELSQPGVLSYGEFQEWCKFYHQEPWGGERDDLQAGVIASTVANVYTLWTQGEAKHRPVDFMPYARAPQHEPTPEQELTPEQLADWADAAFFGIAPETKGD